MRVLVSAGEPSGDLHAASVIQAMRRIDRSVYVEGVGGDAMFTAGATVLQDLAGLGAMGLFEAAGSLGHHVALLRRLKRRIHDGQYDLVVLVDYPGLHLRVARVAEGRVPVLYYIAPQLWAWGEWRAGTLRRTVGRLAVVLPFEEAFFRARGIPAHFVGSPLLDQLPAGRAESRRVLGISPDVTVLGLFPGSRPGDRARHGELFVEAAREVRCAIPGTQVLIACPGVERDGIRPVPNGALVRAAADAGIVKSGTATLEAAIAGMPMAVAYRMHALTYAIARRLVRIPHVSLVNLVAGRPIVPEFIQWHATPATLARTVIPLLDRGNPAARSQVEAFHDVRHALGRPGAAERVAAMALEMAA